MAKLPIHAICVVLSVAVVAALLSGCQAKKPPQTEPAAEVDYTHALPPGALALEKIPPGQYPDFGRSLLSANKEALLKSAKNSLAWFNRPSSAKKYPYLDIDHARAKATIAAIIDLLNSNLDADGFNRRLAEDFDVYQSVGAPSADGRSNTHDVLFTGYYTPTYDASPVRAGEYQWPLYKRPADLITDATTDTAGRRSADGSLAPYLTRQQIETGALAGDELVWLKDRWSAYVITVQGSARLRFADGRVLEVGYAGSNGHAYGSPGLKMVADGLIAEKDLSFEAMREYFARHPQAMDKYLWQNPRTVFFAEVHGGPFGSLNVPVTAFASIATDKDVYPPGLPAFLVLPMTPQMQDAGLAVTGKTDEQSRAYSGFMFDQDRGGAIRSAGRCDIYMGIGVSAEKTAGYQLNAGQLYYVVVKPGHGR